MDNIRDKEFLKATRDRALIMADNLRYLSGSTFAVAELTPTERLNMEAVAKLLSNLQTVIRINPTVAGIGFVGEQIFKLLEDIKEYDSEFFDNLYESATFTESLAEIIGGFGEEIGLMADVQD